MKSWPCLETSAHLLLYNSEDAVLHPVGPEAEKMLQSFEIDRKKTGRERYLCVSGMQPTYPSFS